MKRNSRQRETRESQRGENVTTVDSVSGRWLVKAILSALVVAGVALYLTVCLLFYQGQWQFTFSPPGSAGSRPAADAGLAGSWATRTGPVPRAAPVSAAAIAASSGLPITDEHFDTTEEGVELLDGWWVPASTDSSIVVLFCPDGRSDLPGNLDALRAFHALGLSVFAFDYRGFGKSERGHPSQQKSYEDGMAALRHLRNAGHIDPTRIVIYGAGLGAAVAVQIASQSPRIAGVVLVDPQPSLAKQVRREQHIHLLPMWLIFPDRFDISKLVPSLKMPKLVIATNAEPEYRTGARAIYHEAVGAKEIVRVNVSTAVSLYTQPAWIQAVRGFFDSLGQ